MITEMQRQFEDWCKVNELRVDRQRSMLGGDMGRYDFAPTQFSWEIWQEAWQASRAAVVVKLPDWDCYDTPRQAVEACEDRLKDAGVVYEQG